RARGVPEEGDQHDVPNRHHALDPEGPKPGGQRDGEWNGDEPDVERVVENRVHGLYDAAYHRESGEECDYDPAEPGERPQEHQQEPCLRLPADVWSGDDASPVLCDAPPPSLRCPCDLLLPSLQGGWVLAHYLDAAQVYPTLSCEVHLYRDVAVVCYPLVRPLTHTPEVLRPHEREPALEGEGHIDAVRSHLGQGVADVLVEGEQPSYHVVIPVVVAVAE